MTALWVESRAELMATPIGLSALAQPRLTKGRWPYLMARMGCGFAAEIFGVSPELATFCRFEQKKPFYKKFIFIVYLTTFFSL
jgi:hypothetical protein